MKRAIVHDYYTLNTNKEVPVNENYIIGSAMGAQGKTITLGC